MKYISKLTLPVVLLALLSICLRASEDKPHVVLVVGTLHYSPELTMPVFAEELERFGFETTVIYGGGDPEKKTANVLPGIEALYEADVAIFFCRFMKLPDEEWKPIEDYIMSGKPVVGLRTANHSFRYPKDHPLFEWNDGFGRRVLGGPYVVHQQGTTDISVVEKALKHPIMANVTKTNWVSEGTLYLTRLETGCIPLVTGTGKGKNRLLQKAYGPLITSTLEADIVAWAWENEWGGKVFGTSFGHPGDFAEASFNRMLINAVCWMTGKPLPGPKDKISTWNIKRADK